MGGDPPHPDALEISTISANQTFKPKAVAKALSPPLRSVPSLFCSPVTTHQLSRRQADQTERGQTLAATGQRSAIVTGEVALYTSQADVGSSLNSLR